MLTVRTWVKSLKARKLSVKDDRQIGRPNTLINNANSAALQHCSSPVISHYWLLKTFMLLTTPWIPKIKAFAILFHCQILRNISAEGLWASRIPWPIKYMCFCIRWIFRKSTIKYFWIKRCILEIEPQWPNFCRPLVIVWFWGCSTCISICSFRTFLILSWLLPYCYPTLGV